MNDFDPGRSAAIRAGLIDQARAPLPRRRRALWAIGLLTAGALVGAGASAGAFAATGSLQLVPATPTGEPSPHLPDAVDAPAGVIPGAPLVVLLGAPRSVSIEGPLEVPLTERPAEATHARVTITALTAGDLSWGTDASGNNPSGSWNDDDVPEDGTTSTWYDFPLDGTTTALYLTPAGRFTGIATVQYITQIPTRLGINARGESYGVGGPGAEPDLVAVSGTAPDGSAVEGYARATDLAAFSPDHPEQPSNREQALRWQSERDERYPGGWDIDVYASDGETVLGTFHIGS